MDEKLFTVKDLAERWQKDEGTIRRYVREGILTPCKGVPGMMFSPAYIAKLEGIELERFSPVEKKKIERERDAWKFKYDELSSVLANILGEASKIISVRSNSYDL